MMKKMAVISMVFGLALAGNAMATADGAGCGVGQQLFKGKTGLVNHVLAFSVNGTFSGTSSITSGTSGCHANDSTLMREKEQREFISLNQDNLSLDMAQGRGEYLSTLTGLMGCSVEAQGDFARMTQSKYAELAGSSDMLNAIKSELAADPKLAKACSRIS
ncbi:MAG: DUF3015 domain-containing protein [Deltaproteobacteria bacterium]|nr:DUF3015 domain-containing protein [Deltaproteobacteria bacterium]